ncbi:hypothetical protein HMPREF1139_1835 [Campylobacter sp. FOBRC14]|nr:hypothetical protein HMPREF1139_1835 [Campylobacter sp. FOBRC14]
MKIYFGLWLFCQDQRILGMGQGISRSFLVKFSAYYKDFLQINQVNLRHAARRTLNFGLIFFIFV